MALSRKRIQELFLKDAERARQRKEQAFQKRLTAKDSSGRLLEVGAGALGGFLTGGPAGAVVGAGSAAFGEGDPLESVVKGAGSGLVTKGLEASGDISKTLGAASKLENVEKTLPILQQAGVPSKFIKGLETYAKTQKAARIKETEAESKQKIAKEKTESAKELAILKAEEDRKTKLLIEESKAKREFRKAKGESELKAKRAARKEGVARYDKFKDELKKENGTKNEMVQDYIQFKLYGKVPETETVTKKRFFGILPDKEVEVRTGDYVKEGEEDKFKVGKVYTSNGKRARYKGNGDWELL